MECQRWFKLLTTKRDLEYQVSNQHATSFLDRWTGFPFERRHLLRFYFPLFFKVTQHFESFFCESFPIFSFQISFASLLCSVSLFHFTSIPKLLKSSQIIRKVPSIDEWWGLFTFPTPFLLFSSHKPYPIQSALHLQISWKSTQSSLYLLSSCPCCHCHALLFSFLSFLLLLLSISFQLLYLIVYSSRPSVISFSLS